MPLEAFESPSGDRVVTPFEVKSGEDVFCKHCEGRMRVRRSYTRESGVVVIRHFTHIPENENGGHGNSCGGGGEGDPHLRAKGIAVETLGQFYPDGEVESERRFELSGFFEKDTRIGDAVVTFDEPKPVLGSGIVIEVQDKHKNKDVLETTRAYLSKGYSVCWLSVDSFGKYSLKYGKEEFERLVRNEFPDGEGVFGAELNPDGTVPRKEMYPLVASVWPDGVEVTREIQPRVDSGWFYPAYHSDGRGRTKLQAEGETESTIMNGMPAREVQLPKEWYEERARQYYRETTWGELFTGTTDPSSDARAMVQQSGDRTSPKAQLPLLAWLAKEELCMVIGTKMRKPDCKQTWGDSTPKGGRILSDYGDQLNLHHQRQMPSLDDNAAAEWWRTVAVVVPSSSIDEHNSWNKNAFTPSKDEEIVVSGLDDAEFINNLTSYAPRALVWRDTDWSELFTGGHERHLAQAVVPRSPTTRSTTVYLPARVSQRVLYDMWLSEKHPLQHQNSRFIVAPDSVEIQIPFNTILPRDFWYDAWESGHQSRHSGLEEPFGPFDDVQCHNCGHYIYAKNADECCKNCGTEYDWEWNVQTGRVSPDSVPTEVELE